LLAGRKLLLADDSLTIQKVVDLTFADEGVSVVCVNNGREAIEKLEEFTPDVVLADVFMPQVNGYEVCEYIKQSEKLKHIPVMLLVGSFEPYDEAEARRVGANDTLTKPFQSIRRLLDKVGILVSGRQPEELIPTAELPKPDDAPEPEVEKLTTAELEITTADTQPLPAELRHVVEEAAARASVETSEQSVAMAAANAVYSQQQADDTAEASAPAEVVKQAIEIKEETRGESRRMETRSEASARREARYDAPGEELLDLGDFQTGSSQDDDFVLDLDLDEAPEESPAEPAFASSSFSSQRRYSAGTGSVSRGPSANWSPATITAELPTPDQLARTQEFRQDFGEAVHDSSPGIYADAPFAEAAVKDGESGLAAAPASTASPSSVAASPSSSTESASSSGEVSLQQLSPEMIDAIAQRVVEHLSEKVVQDIAWEVVPQLAELLIKRQLEEKNS
jgi:CheY-like chemotaxis protein